MKLNEILGTEFPIIQGGMANIATGEFAAAVSNAGALGLIGAGGMTAELLRERLKRAEAKLRRLYGLYGDSGDAYLLEAIGDAREEVGRVQTAIAEEASRGAESQAVLNACQKLEGLEDAWPYMSVREQRVVLASVVESITISTDYTDIQLKFGLSVE